MTTRANQPTLVSLARELGVSRQTVSNVINTPEIVSPATRVRVQAAIERSGYRPSALGRALRHQRSHVIAYRLAPGYRDIQGAVMDHFLHALTHAAGDAGYRLSLVTALDEADEARQLERLYAACAIDACVLSDTSSDDSRPETLARADVPFVAFGRPWGALPGDHAWVDVDGAAATRDALAHLVAAGHERIGFIGWPAGSGVGDDRRRGWREGIEGMPDADADHWSVAVDGTDAADGRRAAHALKDRGMTAAVCASDALAIAAVPVFAEAGRPFVPVIGFDDTPTARALGVSSCAQPVEEAAAWCIDRLVCLIETPTSTSPSSGGVPDVTPSPTHHLIPARLVIRERATS